MTELFDEGGLRITSTQLEFGSSTYPLSLVEDSTPVRMSPEIITFLLNAGIGVGGVVVLIAGITQGEIIPGLFVGGMMMAWGWFVGRIVLKVDHILSIDFHDGRELRIKSPSYDFVERAHRALTSARRS